MAAGSLCGITITPLLIGLSVDEEATPVSLLATTAAAFNCSVNGSDVGCITGLHGSTAYATTSLTTAARVSASVTSTIVDELLNKVSYQ